jgi:hypothetical protein
LELCGEFGRRAQQLLLLLLLMQLRGDTSAVTLVGAGNLMVAVCEVWLGLTVP